MNEFGERRLAESYVMRRLAQLTIYQWTKMNEWATGQGIFQHALVMVRVIKVIVHI